MTLRGPITLGKQPSRTILRSVAIHVIQMTVTLLVCLSGLGQATTSRAQEGVTVRPGPLSPEIEAGSTGAVDILVEDVTGLYGVEFEITFDPTVVEVVDADPDSDGVQIQPGDFLSPDWLLDNTVDNDNGTISYALCQWGASRPSQSGDGVLSVITFRGKAVGTSPIHFAHVLLAAKDGMTIQASAEDGQIVISAEPAPASAPTTVPTETPTPTPTATPTATPAPPTSTPTATPTATPVPPTTSTPPATALLEATDPSAATPSSVLPGTATPAGVPTTAPTLISTAVAVAEGMETSSPIPATVRPTIIIIPTSTSQPAPPEAEATPPPLTPTPLSPSDSSEISTSGLMQVALACLLGGTLLLAAGLGAWALWRRRQ